MTLFICWQLSKSFYCLPSSEAVTLKSPRKVLISVLCIIKQDDGHARGIKVLLWRSVDIGFMPVAHEGQAGHMTSSLSAFKKEKSSAPHWLCLLTVSNKCYSNTIFSITSSSNLQQIYWNPVFSNLPHMSVSFIIEPNCAIFCIMWHHIRKISSQHHKWKFVFFLKKYLKMSERRTTGETCIQIINNTDWY